MKPFKQILIWLTLVVLVSSIVEPAIAADPEKWRKDLGKDYTKVLKAKSKKIERHRSLVKKWWEKGHLADLIRLYKSDVVTEHADVALHYGLGYAYAIQGGEDALEKSANQFQQAISLNPDLALAHFSLGGVYRLQEKYDLALVEIETCLQLNPEYYPAHYKRGEIYLQQGNFDEALQSFQAAMEIKPKWAYPHYGMGLVYFEQGDDDAAREAFEQTINRDKRFAPAHFKLGQILAKAGFFEDALGAYKTGAKYQPYTAEVLYKLGAIFAQGGNPSVAITLHQRAITIDSGYAPAHLQLGEIYYEMNEEDLAISHYKQAIEADPSVKDYFIEQLAPYHAGLMGVDKVKSLLNLALAVNPDDPRVYFYYAQIEADAGTPTAAIQHYEKTIEFIESDKSYLEIELPLGNFLDAYLSLGDLYYQQGDHEQAAATYRRAIELDPELERHFFDLGKAAFDVEQFDLSIEPFKKFLTLNPPAEWKADAERYLRQLGSGP